MTRYKFAAIQTLRKNNLNHNLETASKFIDEAASNGALVVALPEYFNIFEGDLVNKSNSEYGETLDGPTATMLSKAAARNNIILIGGSIIEYDPTDKKYYNTSLVYGKDGKLITKYRKIHLFEGFGYSEKTYCDAGSEVCIIDLGFTKIGLAICHDIRFPELSLIFGQQKCSLIVYPTAIDYKSGELFWENLVKIRGFDIYSYCAGVNSADDGSDFRTYGHSLISDPMGQVVSKIDGPSEGVIYADIDLEKIKVINENCPVPNQRRLATTISKSTTTN
eukprot:gene8495-10440_t